MVYCPLCNAERDDNSEKCWCCGYEDSMDFTVFRTVGPVGVSELQERKVALYRAQLRTDTQYPVSIPETSAESRTYDRRKLFRLYTSLLERLGLLTTDDPNVSRILESVIAGKFDDRDTSDTEAEKPIELPQKDATLEKNATQIPNGAKEGLISELPIMAGFRNQQNTVVKQCR